MSLFDLPSVLLLGAMVVYVAAQVWLNRSHPEPNAAAAAERNADLYQQAAESMRHYATLRFSQLTVLMAFATVVAGALTLRDDADGAFRLVAMVTTFAFLVMQERAVDHWKHAQRAAIAIEKQWGTPMFSGWKEQQVLSATNAMRLVHLLLGDRGLRRADSCRFARYGRTVGALVKE